MFLGPVGDDPKITEVRRLGLRKGDVVVIRVPGSLDDGERKRITASARRAFSGLDYVPRVIVLARDMDIEVIGPEAAGTQKVHVEISGGDADELVRTLHQYIRRNGGSAQTVLGS